jgi:hypothetical protein
MPNIQLFHYRRYLKTMTFLIVLALGAVLALNLLADPYGAYRLVGGDSFACWKEGLSTRIGKGESLSHHGWNIILLGNSRVEVGLDPQHRAWGAARVFNAGLSASDFDEINLAAHLAMKNPSLGRMIVCLDVGDFISGTPHEEYVNSLLNPRVNRIEYHLANLFGIAATRKSMATISNAWRHRPAGCWRQGIREIPLRTRGHADWKLDDYHDFFAGEEPVEHPRIDPGRLRVLAELLADASRRGIAVQLVELPVHAVCLERLFLGGKWEMSAQWMGSVVKVVEEHNRRFPAAMVEFREFVGYSIFATEPVPAAGETTTRMHWFWDAVHFRKELGDLVIDRLTGHPPPAGVKLDDFGVVVNADNIDEYLQRVRRGHEAFLRDTKLK